MNSCAKAAGKREENHTNSEQRFLVPSWKSESQKELLNSTPKVICGIRSGRGDHLPGVWVELFCWSCSSSWSWLDSNNLHLECTYDRCSAFFWPSCSFLANEARPFSSFFMGSWLSHFENLHWLSGHRVTSRVDFKVRIQGSVLLICLCGSSFTCIETHLNAM